MNTRTWDGIHLCQWDLKNYFPARKRDFKHGHQTDAGSQWLQGLEHIFLSEKTLNLLQVSHVRNYKMQMRMGIHSGEEEKNNILNSMNYSLVQGLALAGSLARRCHISQFLETRCNDAIF